MSNQDAIQYIYQLRCGTIQELTQKIGSSNLQKFKVVGYIATGVSLDGEKTWKITEKMENIYNNTFSKPSFCSKILGLFCHYILRY